MTPRQKELARHALGLKDGRKKSYRNRFFAGQGHPDYDDWIGLVRAGHAIKHSRRPVNGDFLFTLTTAGAQAVLEPAETLCPEDFPEAA